MTSQAETTNSPVAVDPSATAPLPSAPPPASRPVNPSAAAAIRAAVLDALGPGGWAALGPAGQALVAACCADAAAIQLALLGSADDPSAADRVRREKAHVDAQLASLGAVAARRASDALWAAAAAALLRAGRLVAAGA